MGRSFPEVLALAIAVASLLPNLAGGLVHCWLARRTHHGGVAYGAAATTLGILYTIGVATNHPAHPDFMALIVPLHTVVTVVTVVFVPASARWLEARFADAPDSPTRRSSVGDVW